MWTWFLLTFMFTLKWRLMNGNDYFSWNLYTIQTWNYFSVMPKPSLGMLPSGWPGWGAAGLQHVLRGESLTLAFPDIGPKCWPHAYSPHPHQYAAQGFSVCFGKIGAYTESSIFFLLRWLICTPMFLPCANFCFHMYLARMLFSVMFRTGVFSTS